MKIAVVGGTGTAGSRVAALAQEQGHDVVVMSRSSGVDLVTGAGLAEALDGAQVAIDTSSPTPPDESMSRFDAVVRSARNLVHACVDAEVRRLVALSIANVEKPDFDTFSYYVAKRDQEETVRNSGLEVSVVRSAQWFEFAERSSAVSYEPDRVTAEDWYVQPIAVDAVAEVLVREATRRRARDVTIAGPEAVRLPDLVRRLLAARGDGRPVTVVEPPLPGFANGALLAGPGTEILGPNVAGWIAGRRSQLA
ncbi:NAD(P)H-binding protein [Sinomonas sp. ASV486]|uniref:SDR family oxidoreductase n=1 Tax=Sinomonas sp. ASV486 TaxID=3051170 RepID=UPI0027DC3ACB|nr:NAD(P)H-binding protein [Sinomonas sp. ASV486]MDQ4491572.1 NAD(P)H-binding protein [Sinomonas sp. ASV486]